MIDGGDWHTCAVAGTGGAYCWGYGAFGQLGRGSTAGSTSPVAVSLGTEDLQRIAAASYYIGHTCGQRSTGELACWGYNAQGQVGDESTSQRNAPTRSHHTEAAAYFGDPDLAAARTTITAGYYQSLAVHAGGAASGWGYGANGRLGNGRNSNTSRPTRVAVDVRQ